MVKKAKNKSLIFLLSTNLLVIFFSFIFTNSVFAEIQITEIMYDLQTGSDTDREWIEIYNPDSVSIDITKLKLNEANTNHSISISSGSDILNPSEYAVIADMPTNFLIDNPSYSGILFDSTFSLSNTGETLELRDASGTVLDSVTYDSSLGANGEGNSLQKINNMWLSSIPTPGLVNVISTSTATSSDTNNNSMSTATSNQNTQTTRVVTRTIYVSAHSGTEDLSIYSEKQPFEITAGRERMALVGSPLEFNAKYSLLQKGQCNPSFKWSFGDGFEATGENALRGYKYPGEYQVVLNGNCGEYNAVSRTIVKAIFPNILISSLSDGDMEITNNNKMEINVGNWNIKNKQKVFVFPRDTIIGSGMKIILSKEDLGIGSFPDRVSLNNPLGREVLFINIRNEATSSQTALDQKSITMQESQTSITVTEKSLIEPKPKIAMIKQQTNKIENTKKTNIVGDDSENINNKDIIQTASAIDFVNSSSSDSFLSKLLYIPIQKIKSFARIFYDF